MKEQAGRIDMSKTSTLRGFAADAKSRALPKNNQRGKAAGQGTAGRGGKVWLKQD